MPPIQRLRLATEIAAGRLAGATEISECIFAGTPVLDAPFSAEAVTVWHPPANSGRAELRATARYYRDRAGRVRVDQFFVGREPGRQRIIVTPDHTSRAAYLLDPGARTASKSSRDFVEMMVGGGCFGRFVLPLSMSRFIWFHQLPSANRYSSSAFEEEPLGQQLMAGIQVTGTRYRTMLSPGPEGIPRAFELTDERWVSPELKLVVHSRGEGSEVGIVEYQLTRINRADPPAELFEVPADYVETPLSGWTWENPYGSKAGRLGPGLDRRQ